MVHGLLDSLDHSLRTSVSPLAAWWCNPPCDLVDPGLTSDLIPVNVRMVFHSLVISEELLGCLQLRTTITIYKGRVAIVQTVLHELGEKVLCTVA